MNVPFSIKCGVALGNRELNGDVRWSPGGMTTVTFDQAAFEVGDTRVPYAAIERAILNRDKTWLGTNYTLVVETGGLSCLLNFGDAEEVSRSLPFETESIDASDTLGLAAMTKRQLIMMGVLIIVVILLASGI